MGLSAGSNDKVTPEDIKVFEEMIQGQTKQLLCICKYESDAILKGYNRDRMANFWDFKIEIWSARY